MRLETTFKAIFQAFFPLATLVSVFFKEEWVGSPGEKGALVGELLSFTFSLCLIFLLLFGVVGFSVLGLGAIGITFIVAIPIVSRWVFQFFGFFIGDFISEKELDESYSYRNVFKAALEFAVVGDVRDRGEVDFTKLPPELQEGFRKAEPVLDEEAKRQEREKIEQARREEESARKEREEEKIRREEKITEKVQAGLQLLREAGASDVEQYEPELKEALSKNIEVIEDLRILTGSNVLNPYRDEPFLLPEMVKAFFKNLECPTAMAHGIVKLRKFVHNERGVSLDELKKWCSLLAEEGAKAQVESVVEGIIGLYRKAKELCKKEPDEKFLTLLFKHPKDNTKIVQLYAFCLTWKVSSTIQQQLCENLLKTVKEVKTSTQEGSVGEIINRFMSLYEGILKIDDEILSNFFKDPSPACVNRLIKASKEQQRTSPKDGAGEPLDGGRKREDTPDFWPR